MKRDGRNVTDGKKSPDSFKNYFDLNLNGRILRNHTKLGGYIEKLGGCPKLKKREILLLYYYSYTIVYDFTARITIVIPNILKYSRDDFISVLR